MDQIQKLKISLMSNGIQISHEAHIAIAGSENNPLSVFDYVTTSGLVLILPGKIYVNANFKEESCKYSENILDFDKTFFIRSPIGKIEVQYLPVPSYIMKKISTGRPVTEIIMTHADRMRISPIRGCNNRCQFCDMGTAFPYRKAGLDEIHEALMIALLDLTIAPKHLLISGGTPIKNDEDYIDSVYKEIISTCPVPVDVMMAPREDFGILERLKDWGCNGLSINLEINDELLAQKIMPEKFLLGKEAYLKFIEQAVKIFGRGAVRSCLILGLESVQSTLEGVKLLAQIGCDPVLSPFKPLNGTLLAGLMPPSPEFQEYVYTEAQKIVKENGVILGPRCIPCQHNTLTFPDEGNGYFFN